VEEVAGEVALGGGDPSGPTYPNLLDHGWEIWSDMKNAGSFRDYAGIEFLHQTSKFSRGPTRELL
jgi:hypothetical protein